MFWSRYHRVPDEDSGDAPAIPALKAAAWVFKMHQDSPKDFLKTLSPMGIIAAVPEIVDAVIYLTEAPHVTGEVLHVDGGAHIGKW
jgi:hypothetical protein